MEVYSPSHPTEQDMEVESDSVSTPEQDCHQTSVSSAVIPLLFNDNLPDPVYTSELPISDEVTSQSDEKPSHAQQLIATSKPSIEAPNKEETKSSISSNAESKSARKPERSPRRRSRSRERSHDRSQNRPSQRRSRSRSRHRHSNSRRDSRSRERYRKKSKTPDRRSGRTTVRNRSRSKSPKRKRPSRFSGPESIPVHRHSQLNSSHVESESDALRSTEQPEVIPWNPSKSLPTHTSASLGGRPVTPTSPIPNAPVSIPGSLGGLTLPAISINSMSTSMGWNQTPFQNGPMFSGDFNQLPRMPIPQRHIPAMANPAQSFLSGFPFGNSGPPTYFQPQIPPINQHLPLLPFSPGPMFQPNNVQQTVCSMPTGFPPMPVPPNFGPYAPPPPPPPPPPPSFPQFSRPPVNLLETLMSKAGLPRDTLNELVTTTQSETQVQPVTSSDNSPMKKINKLLSSAANSLLNQLANNRSISDLTSSEQVQQAQTVENNTFDQTSMASYVPPPLPIPVSVSSEHNVALPVPNGDKATKSRADPFAGQNIEDVLLKRKRHDFANRREWQERIALEVKFILKPAYSHKKITKEDYKEIMKKSVTKISRSGTSTINTEKIKNFVKQYIEKYYRMNKLKAHSASKNVVQ